MSSLFLNMLISENYAHMGTNDVFTCVIENFGTTKQGLLVEYRVLVGIER